MSQTTCYFFFFNDTATTEIYTLSLHDALPISGDQVPLSTFATWTSVPVRPLSISHQGQFPAITIRDRKSTRLNSSHSQISYAVFCLKKKNHHDDSLPTLAAGPAHCTANRFTHR